MLLCPVNRIIKYMYESNKAIKFSNIFQYPSLFLHAGLRECWLFKDSLPSWPPGEGKECNIVFEVTPLDPNFHECEWLCVVCPCLWNISDLISTYNTNFIFLIQKENQNHSYSLKSSASFNVIEFPYKNLSFEDIHNSTVVSHLHPLWVNINNYFKINEKRKIAQ